MAAQGSRDIGDAHKPEQIERGVATGGEIGGGTVGTHLTGVLAQGHIAHVVQAVLDLPVVAPELFQPCGIRLRRRQTGQRIRPLTGDLARADEEGYFYIVGRRKDMYISGGENVYPAEVEGALATHPDVAEVAVLCRPDARWGEVGLAVVVAREPGALTAEELVAHCADKLARYKIPKAFVFTDVLPRNAMGKVIKAQLYDCYVARTDGV